MEVYGFLWLIFGLIFAALYFLPTIVAFRRHATVRGTVAVAVLNLFLGWTFIGWVISLAMAFGSTEQKGIIVQTNVEVKTSTEKDTVRT